VKIMVGAGVGTGGKMASPQYATGHFKSGGLMSFTIDDQINQKIKAKKKELSRQQIKQQLSRNGYGKYTTIETEMVTSKAWSTMNGSCKDLMLYFLLKRKFRYKKGKTPICLNPDDISMTYKEFESPPFNWTQEKFRRCKRVLLARGFWREVYKGGKFKKDKNIYGISDKWMLWRDGIDFYQNKRDVNRGFQGKNLGAIKNKISTQN
jgi:hypothetical protein